MWLFQRILYLSIIAVAIAIGLKAWKHLSKVFRAVLILLVITLFAEGIGVWMAYKGSNSFLYHLFNPIECALWCYIYYHLFTNKYDKRAIIVLSISTIIFMFANSVWIQPFFRKVNYYSIVAESGFLLLGSLLFFKELLRRPDEGDILRLSFFWLNCAVMFFYTINILFWISYGFLRSHNKTMLHAGFQLVIYTNYILYLIIGYAFLLEAKRKKEFTY